MLTHFGFELTAAEWEESVVCIGTFDGVHLGHQAVIQEAVRQGKDHECPCALVTFDRHPAATLAPGRQPLAVASMGQNLRQFARLGVGLTMVVPFDKATSELPAQSFFDKVLVQALRARRVVVGHDFAMGHGREGTTDWLAQRIETTVVPPFELDGMRVSSTAVRAGIASGDLEQVAKLLGRPFALEGVVVRGHRLGRKLGYPTANLALAGAHATPPDGVYAGTASTGAGTFRAAISLGVRQAAGGGDRTLEAYLLDYAGDSLYGQCVEIAFHSKLRDQRDFPTLDGLTAQIARDVESVHAMVTL